MRRVLAVALLAAIWTSTAEAHKPSDSYLDLSREGSGLSGQWDIALRDLDHALGLDRDGDGSLTWGEVRTRHEAIAAYALSHLRIAGDGEVCPTRVTEHLIDRHTDGAYAVLRFAVDCPRPPRRLDLDYSLFFDLDPQHRGVMQLSGRGEARHAIFTAEGPAQSLALETDGPWSSVGRAWRDGVWELGSEPAAILFLVFLLFPAVGGSRELWRTIEVATAFAVAHSLTLTLTALGVLHLPSPLVQAGVAASVGVAALNRAVPLFDRRRWVLGFACGLLLGSGFGAGFAATGVPAESLVSALLAFNLGLESGVLLLVGTFLLLASRAGRVRPALECGENRGLLFGRSADRPCSGPRRRAAPPAGRGRPRPHRACAAYHRACVGQSTCVNLRASSTLGGCWPTTGYPSPEQRRAGGSPWCAWCW